MGDGAWWLLLASIVGNLNLAIVAEALRRAGDAA